MGILSWILFGLLAGAVAQVLVPGNDPGGGGPIGLIATIAIGILGAFVGGFIAIFLGFGGVTGFNVGSFVVAVFGAVTLLLVWRLLTRTSHVHA